MMSKRTQDGRVESMRVELQEVETILEMVLTILRNVLAVLAVKVVKGEGGGRRFVDGLHCESSGSVVVVLHDEFWELEVELVGELGSKGDCGATAEGGREREAVVVKQPVVSR